MKNKIFGISLFTLILFCSVLFFAGAEGSKPKILPLNPDFLKFWDDVRNGIDRNITPDGEFLGFIPPPAHNPNYRGKVDFALPTSFPSQYDLRTQSKLTPVRDQGSCSSDWAFPAYGSLESYLMPGETRDFSEKDLISSHGFDYSECDGGNHFMAMAYLTRWSGPLDESDVPYPYSISDPKVVPALQKKILQVLWLPDRSDSLDNDTIKDHIMNYGAVAASMNFDPSSYNGTTYSHYYSGSGPTNHGIALVGWDDDFDKNNFVIPPPGNGAFIVRNSWGDSWGDSGYFFVSYYDAMLGWFLSFNNAEETNIYDYIYSLSPFGWTSTTTYGGNVEWAANVFTATDDQTLEAVGLFIMNPNTDVTIYIYTGVTGTTNPINGALKATKMAFFTYAGYQTVDLTSGVNLTNGEKFSVVVRYEVPSGDAEVAMERPVAGHSSAASANPGESFLSDTGASGWFDLDNYDGNCCIVAYADGLPSHPDINVKLLSMNIADGSIFNFGTMSVKKVVKKEVPFTIQNTGTASLELTGSPRVTLSGTGSNYFEVSMQPAASVAPGGQTVFKIKCKFSSVPPKLPPGWQTTISIEVTIPNNDPDENPYNFTLYGNIKN